MMDRKYRKYAPALRLSFYLFISPSAIISIGSIGPTGRQFSSFPLHSHEEFLFSGGASRSFDRTISLANLRQQERSQTEIDDGVYTDSKQNCNNLVHYDYDNMYTWDPTTRNTHTAVAKETIASNFESESLQSTDAHEPPWDTPEYPDSSGPEFPEIHEGVNGYAGVQFQSEATSAEMGNNSFPFNPWEKIHPWARNLGRRSSTTDDDPSHIPIKYKYYSRHRAHRSSIPFILIGPNVDHWKITSQQLAARGFSVIVCERAEDTGNGVEDDNEGSNLILGLLEALRWTRAVIVGCDSEAKLAIQASLQLAPDRVAGLVLCGDLTEVNRSVMKWVSPSVPRTETGTFEVDKFLKEFLRCPFAVVWDGEAPPLASTVSPVCHSDVSPLAEALGGNRSLILGGGSAPHRRRPEQLAWVLARFVEGKISASSNKLCKQNSDNRTKLSRSNPLDELLSSGSLVVFGRYAASILFYVTMIKIGIYQYDNFRGGVIRIKSGLDMISSLRRSLFQGVSNFVVNFGYISHVIHRKSGKMHQVLQEIGADKDIDTETNIDMETDVLSDPFTEPNSDTATNSDVGDADTHIDTDTNTQTHTDTQTQTDTDKDTGADIDTSKGSDQVSLEQQDERQDDSKSAEEDEKIVPERPDNDGNKKFSPAFFLDHVIA